jgi:hypothetical protein
MTLLTATRPASRTDRHAPRTDGPVPPSREVSADRFRIMAAPTTECRCLLAAVGRCPTQGHDRTTAT